MALIKRALVRFGPGVAAGYIYDTETLVVSRVGATNNGTGTLWVQLTHVPSGRKYQRTINPGSSYTSPDISAHGLTVSRQDWEDDFCNFSTEASYTG